MKEIARHRATVVSTRKGAVKVLVTTMGACGSCDAQAHCGFTQGRDKEMVIDTSDWALYENGEVVEVQVRESLGFLAVWWGYMAPAVLLLACVVLTLSLGGGEPLAVLVALGVVTLYYLVLYLFKGKLQRQFTIGISKILRSPAAED